MTANEMLGGRYNKRKLEMMVKVKGEVTTAITVNDDNNNSKDK